MAKPKKVIEPMKSPSSDVTVELIAPHIDPHQTNILLIKGAHIHFYEGKSTVSRHIAELLIARGDVHELPN